MSPEHGHNRILLSKNSIGRLAFCEDCDVVELEIGAISLRLHAQDMPQFSALIKEAELRLHDCRLETSRHEAELMKIGGVH
jgi:hypothetical protein